MTLKNISLKGLLKKGGCIIAGILLALLFAAPYLVFRDEIRALGGAGYLGVLISCAISNVSVLLPTSSTLIVLSASTALNPLLCILMGGIGTALGEQASYFCGRVGGAGFDDHEKAPSDCVLRWIEAHEFLTIFLFAFVPLPVFDIVGLASGAKKVSWLKYTAAAVLGKTLKFSIAAIFMFLILPAAAGILPEPLGQIIAPLLKIIEG